MKQKTSISTSEDVRANDYGRLLACLKAYAGIDTEADVAERIVPLTPDASTRKYFRVPFKETFAVAALYPEAFEPTTQPFLDVTRLFESCALPVPRILAVDATNGVILQEDLGDQQLISYLETAAPPERERLIEEAIDLIARIQAATATAQHTNSIASRQHFDYEKLAWELNYFAKHFFESYRQTPLAENSEVRRELDSIARQLAARSVILCHRDFHGANIIVDKQERLRVIDYQDARIGAASYDLVSLVLDRQLNTPSLAELRARRLLLLERRRAHGLPPLDPDEFTGEFRLTAIQRGLKAVGTFSYQTAINGRSDVYEKYIAPQLAIVLQAAKLLDRFPHLQSALEKQLEHLHH